MKTWCKQSQIPIFGRFLQYGFHVSRRKSEFLSCAKSKPTNSTVQKTYLWTCRLHAQVLVPQENPNFRHPRPSSRSRCSHASKRPGSPQNKWLELDIEANRKGRLKLLLWDSFSVLSIRGRVVDIRRQAVTKHDYALPPDHHASFSDTYYTSARGAALSPVLCYAMLCSLSAPPMDASRAPRFPLLKSSRAVPTCCYTRAIIRKRRRVFCFNCFVPFCGIYVEKGEKSVCVRDWPKPYIFKETSRNDIWLTKWYRKRCENSCMHLDCVKLSLVVFWVLFFRESSCWQATGLVNARVVCACVCVSLLFWIGACAAILASVLVKFKSAHLRMHAWF